MPWGRPPPVSPRSARARRGRHRQDVVASGAEAGGRGAGVRVLSGTASSRDGESRIFRSFRRWRPHSIRKRPMTRRVSCGRPSPLAARAMRYPARTADFQQARLIEAMFEVLARIRPFSASTTCTGRTSRRSQCSTTSPTARRTRLWQSSAAPGTTSHRSSPSCHWLMGGARTARGSAPDPRRDRRTGPPARAVGHRSPARRAPSADGWQPVLRRAGAGRRRHRVRSG